MQNCSPAWKTAHTQTLVPESFVEISYRVGDPAAQFDATATDNGSEAFANTAQVVDELEKVYTPYATFEQDQWILDGSMPLLPEVVTQDMGFVSDVLCGEDRTFNPAPVITISFSQVHEGLIPGVTITWSTAFNEYATEFAVTAYNGSSVVASKIVTDNNNVHSVVQVDIENYDKIEIEILEWCMPFHRARVEEILVGVMEVFTKSELLGYEHTQHVSLLSAELPKAQIVFTLHNIENEWNPDNPQGLWRYLLERQELVVRYGYKVGDSIEWIKAGTFYMSEWDTPSNGISAVFTARDMLEYMRGRFEKTTTTLTLHELATQAFEQSGLPKTRHGEDKWALDNALSSITVTLPEDFDFTRAEVVQLCANAACCVFYQNRDGILIVEPLANVLSDYVINKHVSYANPEYEISKELKSVDVNEGMGTATNSATGEVQTMKNPLIQNGTVADAVADWIKDCLKERRTLSGEFRADPRLDALDKITVENKYATTPVFITNIKYSYGGAFRGEYEGRVATP